jgi:hypothetical protein
MNSAVNQEIKKGIKKSENQTLLRSINLNIEILKNKY